MKSFAIFASLLTLALSAPAPQEQPPTEEATCAVILPILYTLENEFTLVVRNKDAPEIHGATVTFLTVAGGGQRAVLNEPDAEHTNMTLKDSHLGIHDGEKTGFLEVPMKTVYRQLSFTDSIDDPMEFSASYYCDPDTQQPFMKINPYTEDGEPVEFCVAQDFFTDDYGLYVKKIADASADCVSVTAVVTEGIRPL